jgi:hypothetical protein
MHMSIARSQSCPLEGEILKIMHFDIGAKRAGFTFPTTPVEVPTPQEQKNTAKVQNVAAKIFQEERIAEESSEKGCISYPWECQTSDFFPAIFPADY